MYYVNRMDMIGKESSTCSTVDLLSYFLYFLFWESKANECNIWHITLNSMKSTSSLYFNETFGIHPNPLEKRFSQSPVPTKIKLELSVRIQFQHEIFRFVNETLSPFNFLPGEAVPENNLVLKDKAKLTFKLFSQCDQYYYGTNCTTFCKAPSPNYNCSPRGDLVCIAGRYGDSCQFEHKCHLMRPCLNGAECFDIETSNGYECVCTSVEYSGVNCEIYSPTTTKQTTTVTTVTTTTAKQATTITTAIRALTTRDTTSLYEVRHRMLPKEFLYIGGAGLLLILVISILITVCFVSMKGRQKPLPNDSCLMSPPTVVFTRSNMLYSSNEYELDKNEDDFRQSAIYSEAGDEVSVNTAMGIQPPESFDNETYQPIPPNSC